MKKLPLLFSPLLRKLVVLGLILWPMVLEGQVTILPLRCGYYLAGAGDIAWHNDIKFRGLEGGMDQFEYDWGQGISLALGKAQSCWRFEFEGAYRKNNLKRISFTSPSGAIFSDDATGFVRDFTLMFNGYWDVYIPCSWWIFYIGGGLGVTFHERQSCSTFSDLEKASNTLFAWQGMAGFSYEIIEHVFINAGYRLFMSAKPRSSFNHAQSIVLNNNIELGVRIEL